MRLNTSSAGFLMRASFCAFRTWLLASICVALPFHNSLIYDFSLSLFSHSHGFFGLAALCDSLY